MKRENILPRRQKVALPDAEVDPPTLAKVRWIVETRDRNGFTTETVVDSMAEALGLVEAESQWDTFASSRIRRK